MKRQLGWLAAAAGLGFAIPAVFAGRVGLERDVYLLVYLPVTGVYHLGYEEFRGAALAGPLVGNAVVSLAYLLARNPVAPGLAHVAMHIAAVVHGMETAVQLPPHG